MPLVASASATASIAGRTHEYAVLRSARTLTSMPGFAFMACAMVATSCCSPAASGANSRLPTRYAAAPPSFAGITFSTMRSASPGRLAALEEGFGSAMSTNSAPVTWLTRTKNTMRRNAMSMSGVMFASNDAGPR